MNAIKLVGAVVLLIGVAFVPAHVLLHGAAEVDKWLLLFAVFICTIGATLLSERAIKAAAMALQGFLPAKWRGEP